MNRKIHTILDSAIEFKGTPQKQVADDLHINPTTLNNYIKGKREPDLETFIQLLMYLDVDLNTFFSYQGDVADYTITKEEASLLKVFRLASETDKQKIIDIANIIIQKED